MGEIINNQVKVLTLFLVKNTQIKMIKNIIVMEYAKMIIQHFQNQLYLQDICLERFIHRDKMLAK